MASQDNINRPLWEQYPRDRKVIVALIGLTREEHLLMGKSMNLIYKPTEGSIATLSKEIAYLTVMPQGEDKFSVLDLLGESSIEWRVILHTPEGDFLRDYTNLKEIVTLQIQGLLDLDIIPEEIASKKLMELHGGIDKVFKLNKTKGGLPS